MGNQKDTPPHRDTSEYLMWAKEHYLSDDPRKFAAIGSETAEYGRAYSLAVQAGLQNLDAQKLALEYCLQIIRARMLYDPAQPISEFFNTILYELMRKVPPNNGALSE